MSNFSKLFAAAKTRFCKVLNRRVRPQIWHVVLYVSATLHLVQSANELLTSAENANYPWSKQTDVFKQA